MNGGRASSSRPVDAGTFGENLTLTGIDLRDRVLGERWTVGSTLLEVAQPRLPCFKLGIRMGDASFVERFEDARRFGAYLRIVEPGDVSAGDRVAPVSTPSHGFTVNDVFEAYASPSNGSLARMLELRELPESWREWAIRARRRAAR